MKIVIDNKIPFIKGAFENLAEVVYLPGGSITADDVRDADALIVRTRTHCNKDLLEGSQVKFIATATIGFDHIDKNYCEAKGIQWTNAPGCNARSVAQYLNSALACLSNKYNFQLKDKTLGVVGVGHVGRLVVEMASALGMKVLQNDPPRQRKEGSKEFVSLEQICREADIITFHVPLYREGEDKTYHFVDSEFISKLKKQPFLINAARGEVFDTSAVKRALKSGAVLGVVVDCWENEPNIDLELLAKAEIATPHIAGYSADGKANATRMSVQSVSRFFNLGLDNWTVTDIQKPANTIIDGSKTTDKEAILQSYDILADDARLRQSTATFEKQRGDYPLRREYGVYEVKNSQSEVLRQLGFEIK